MAAVMLAQIALLPANPIVAMPPVPEAVAPVPAAALTSVPGAVLSSVPIAAGPANPGALLSVPDAVLSAGPGAALPAAPVAVLSAVPDALLPAAPVALPVLAALLYAIFGWRAWTAWAGVATAVAQLAAAVALAPRLVHGAAVTTAGGLLRADALTGYVLLVIAAVAVIATWASVDHVRVETAAGRTSTVGARRYGILVHAFLAAMGAATLADNLGLMWVALEATTVITAFLVGHRRDRHGLEAAWKYVVLCSAGIAMAFLGTVCVYAAALHAGGHGTTALNWTFLVGHAHELDPGVVRLAAGLALLGFGTKAGLAPVHAWLPDAHSQAPAPVSALMSGVLLSVAFTGILRYKIITDQVLGPGYLRALLLAAALASLAVAALLLIAQRDLKRMLAYSSIEHMGLAALAAAIGGRLAAAALLLHILGHGLAKSVAFTGAGQILQATGTTRLAELRGLLTRRPALAGTFGFALAALAGLPPFPLFASELGIARSGVSAGLGIALAAALAALLVIFAALARHAFGLLLGTPPPTARVPAPGRPDPATTEAPATPEAMQNAEGVEGAEDAQRARGAEDVQATGGTAGGTGGTAWPSGAAVTTRSSGTGSITRPSGAGRAPRPVGSVAPLVLALGAAGVLGTVLGPLRPLLTAAATIVGGH